MLPVMRTRSRDHASTAYPLSPCCPSRLTSASRTHSMHRLTYVRSLKSVRDWVQPPRRDEFELWYAARDKDPAVALTLSVCFGWFGVDRFYVGHIILGILKLITFGGFGFWYIIDWFLIMGAARRANVAIAAEVKQTVG